MAEVQTRLAPWAAVSGVDVDAVAWERLETVVGLWQRYGAAFNLVGDLSTSALIEHVREGLMAVGAAEQAGWDGGPWLDIGSGAGIPGLIVAATRGVVLHVEPRERRAAFLELAIGAINCPESAVVRGRLDGTTWTKIAASDKWERLSGEFSATSTRAVMAVETWLEVGPSVVPRGIVVAHLKADRVAGLPRTPAGRIDFGKNAVIAFPATALVSDRSGDAE